MSSVTLMLVCWPCVVFITLLRYILSTCMRCLRNFLLCPVPKHCPKPKVTYLRFPLQASAATMDFYAQHRYPDLGVDCFRDDFVPEQQHRSRFWGRPFVRWPRHGFMPHEYIDEYGAGRPHRPRCGFFDTPGPENPRTGSNPPPYSQRAYADRRRANFPRYSFYNATNTDDIWPRANSEYGSTVYLGSVEEVGLLGALLTHSKMSLAYSRDMSCNSRLPESGNADSEFYYR